VITWYSSCNLIPRDTALAILAEKDGLISLETDYEPAPVQLLVKEMPGIQDASFLELMLCSHGNWVDNHNAC